MDPHAVKPALLALCAAGALAMATPGLADSLAWLSIFERQSGFDQRVDLSLRDGGLTLDEAQALRDDYAALAALEAQHRDSPPGLTLAETDELDRGFAGLAQRIRRGPPGQEPAGWQTLARRQTLLFQRIEVGLADGGLTAAQAERMRADYDSLLSLEAKYRASKPGLTEVEALDLDRRYNILAHGLNVARDAQPAGVKSTGVKAAELRAGDRRGRRGRPAA